MVKHKNVLIAFFGFFVFALLSQGCGKSEDAKRDEAWAKKRKEIPRDAYPNYFYDKFGDNWYKFRTGAGDEAEHLPRYPIMRIEYVKGEKLPIVLDEKTRVPDYFSLRAWTPNHNLYKDMLDKHRVKRFRFHKSSLFLSPRKFTFLDRPNIKWQAISDDFEVFGWENSRKKPEHLRSRKPLFFDQHVYVSFGTWDIRTAPNPLTKKYVDSDYPYVDVTLEVAFLDKHLSTLGLEEGSEEYLAAYSRYVKAKVKFLEALVADIYVGPELPDDVKAIGYR